MNKTTKGYRLKWFVPLILFISLIIDASLPSVFPSAFLENQQIISSHLMLYFVVSFAFYFRDSNILLYAFIFGLVYDSYNTTIIGFNAVMYVIVAYIVLKIKKYFPKKAYIHYMLFIICISLLDTFTYLFYLEINIARVTMLDFLVMRLTPTLIFNTVLAFFIYFPAKQLMRWLGYNEYIII